MSTALEPDVRAALADAGWEPRAFRHISTLRTPEIDRATFWIETADGQHLKARRLEDETVARTLEDIRRHLPAAFTRILGRHGRVLLEEWVQGEVLGNEPPGLERLSQAGALLGEVHARAELGAQQLPVRRGTAGHREVAEASLRQLVAARALGTTEAETVQRQMRQLDPGDALFGLVHFDFCGENMVIDRTGRLRVVDNDRMGCDALGFDLARAWYRWALPDAEWQCLQSAYAGRVPVAEPLRALPFWRMVAVARAAALRVQAEPSRAGSVIDRLRRLSEEGAP